MLRSGIFVFLGVSIEEPLQKPVYYYSGPGMASRHPCCAWALASLGPLSSTINIRSTIIPLFIGLYNNKYKSFCVEKMPRCARTPTSYEKSTREIADAVVELRRLRKPNLSEYARLHNLPYQRLHRAFNGGNNRSTRAPTNRKLLLYTILTLSTP